MRYLLGVWWNCRILWSKLGKAKLTKLNPLLLRRTPRTIDMLMCTVILQAVAIASSKLAWWWDHSIKGLLVEWLFCLPERVLKTLLCDAGKVKSLNLPTPEELSRPSYSTLLIRGQECGSAINGSGLRTFRISAFYSSNWNNGSPDCKNSKEVLFQAKL